VLDDAKAKNITKDSDPFWVLVAGLNAWRANEGKGLMPVSNNVPDMHSEPKYYVALKDLFKAKAHADLEGITKHVHAILKGVGKDPKTIPDHQIDYFVKNCRSLFVVRTPALETEYDVKSFNAESINWALEGSWKFMMGPDETKEEVIKDMGNIDWYLGMRAIDLFKEKHGRYPGEKDAKSGKEDVEADEKAVVGIADAFFQEFGLRAGKPNEKVLKELVRSGPTEIHTVGAFMGAMASQEVLKLMLAQFVPNNHTVIFNSVHSSITMFKH